MLATEVIQEKIREHLASEIECETIPGDSARVGCVTPLYYPSGDSITIWVEQAGSDFRISDYGEAFLEVIDRKERRAALERVAADIGALWGVQVNRGALLAIASLEELGDAVWRTASVAHRVAEAASGMRPPRTQPDGEHPFIQEVAREFRDHSLPVQRQVRLIGASGHHHKATLFVPTFEAIVEPIHAPAHFNQISSVYTKFGDLSRANGFQRFSVVDDRSESLSEDLTSMLIQVGGVVRWTRREPWLRDLARAS